MATGYEPLETLKPVAESLWIVDGPPPPGGGCRLPTRSVVLRLADGGLWVHAPTRPGAGLRRELDALGPVAHLVVPNPRHLTWAADWAAAYPQAELWAAPGVAARAQRAGLALPGLRELDAGRAEAAWRAEMAQLVPRGHRRFREAVFFHHATATLILADLVQALETSRMHPVCRPGVWLSGVDDSDPKMPLSLRLGLRDGAALAEDIETLIGWAPRRLILSRGRCYAQGATPLLERAFRRVLAAHRWDRALAAHKDQRQDT